jgi:hypothetical protein
MKIIWRKKNAKKVTWAQASALVRADRVLKNASFTAPVESYRMIAITDRAVRKELAMVCSVYEQHGYRLVERSGRDSLDLTFAKVAS